MLYTGFAHIQIRHKGATDVKAIRIPLSYIIFNRFTLVTLADGDCYIEIGLG